MDNQHVREHVYYVKADWDEDAKVWYVANTDVPGLAAEADTPEQLLVLLDELIPELVELNSEGGNRSIPYSVTLDHLRSRRAVA